GIQNVFNRQRHGDMSDNIHFEFLRGRDDRVIRLPIEKRIDFDLVEACGLRLTNGFSTFAWRSYPSCEWRRPCLLWTVECLGQDEAGTDQLASFDPPPKSNLLRFGEQFLNCGYSIGYVGKKEPFERKVFAGTLRLRRHHYVPSLIKQMNMHIA